MVVDAAAGAKGPGAKITAVRAPEPRYLQSWCPELLGPGLWTPLFLAPQPSALSPFSNQPRSNLMPWASGSESDQLIVLVWRRM